MGERTAFVLLIAATLSLAVEVRTHALCNGREKETDSFSPVWRFPPMSQREGEAASFRQAFRKDAGSKTLLTTAFKSGFVLTTWFLLCTGLFMYISDS